MPGLGRRDNRHERPYVIAYVRGDRKLYDSARNLEDAVDRADARLAKRHNKGEVAHIYRSGKLVTSRPHVHDFEMIVNSTGRLVCRCGEPKPE